MAAKKSSGKKTKRQAVSEKVVAQASNLDTKKIKPAVIGAEKKEVSKKGLSSLKASNYYQSYLEDNKTSNAKEKMEVKKAFAANNLKNVNIGSVFDEVTSPISYTREVSSSGYSSHFNRPNNTLQSAVDNFNDTHDTVLVGQPQSYPRFNQQMPYYGQPVNVNSQNPYQPQVPSFVPSQYAAAIHQKRMQAAYAQQQYANPNRFANPAFNASTQQLMDFNPLADYYQPGYGNSQAPLPQRNPQNQNALAVPAKNDAEVMINFISQATKVLSSVQEQLIVQSEILQRQQKQVMRQQEIIDHLHTKYFGEDQSEFEDEEKDINEGHFLPASEEDFEDFDGQENDSNVDASKIDRVVEAVTKQQLEDEEETEEEYIKALPTGEINHDAYTDLVTDEFGQIVNDFEADEPVVEQQKEIADDFVDAYTELVEEEIVPTRIIDSTKEVVEDESEKELQAAKLNPSKRYWEALVGKAKYGFYNNKVWNWYGYFDRLAKWHPYENIEQMPNLPVIHVGLIALKGKNNKPFWEYLVDDENYGHREKGVWIWDGVFDQNCNWIPDPTNPKFYTQNIVANISLSDRERSLIGNELYGYYDSNKKWVWTGHFSKDGTFVSDIVRKEPATITYEEEIVKVGPSDVVSSKVIEDVPPAAAQPKEEVKELQTVEIVEDDFGVIPSESTVDLDLQPAPQEVVEQVKQEEPAISWEELVGNPEYGFYNDKNEWEWKGYFDENNKWVQTYVEPVTIPSYDESIPATTDFAQPEVSQATQEVQVDEPVVVEPEVVVEEAAPTQEVAYEEPSFGAEVSPTQEVQPEYVQEEAAPTQEVAYEEPSFDAEVSPTQEVQPEYVQEEAAPTQEVAYEEPSFDAEVSPTEAISEGEAGLAADDFRGEEQPVEPVGEPTSEVQEEPSIEVAPVVEQTETVVEEPAVEEQVQEEEEVVAQPEVSEPTQEVQVDEPAVAEPEPTQEVEPEVVVQEAAPTQEVAQEQPTVEATVEQTPDAEQQPEWMKYVGNSEYGHYDQNGEWVWAGYFDDNNTWVRDENYVAPQAEEAGQSYIAADAEGKINFDLYIGNESFGYYDEAGNWNWYDGQFDEAGNWYVVAESTEESEVDITSDIPALNGVDTDAVDADDWLSQFGDDDAEDIFG